MHFSKKTAMRQICLYSRATPLVKIWGTSLHEQKKMKKNYRSRMDFFWKKKLKIKISQKLNDTSKKYFSV